jgi:hypothetical protein
MSHPLQLLPLHSCEGRPLSRDEWSRLREYTHLLDSQLQLVDITYNHETDEESPPN